MNDFPTPEYHLSGERDSQKLCRPYPLCGYLASSLTQGLEGYQGGAGTGHVVSLVACGSDGSHLSGTVQL